MMPHINLIRRMAAVRRLLGVEWPDWSRNGRIRGLLAFCTLPAEDLAEIVLAVNLDAIRFTSQEILWPSAGDIYRERIRERYE